ncbi:MAG: dihydropteroate synthase [Candidatus Cryptobacteroides sp.]
MRKVEIMGIVNVTDNSYFAQSRCLSETGTPDMERILRRVSAMLEEGADIIDIGACSTRPGSEPVGEAEEWRRLEPVLDTLWRTCPHIRISIDTYWASVIEKAWALLTQIEGGSADAGKSLGDIHQRLIVNDISAGEDDPGMLPLVGRLGLRYIAMHKRGTPKTMQGLCDYGNVTQDIGEYFREFARRASDAGISDWVLDPGFGFAKTAEQNWELLRNLHWLSEEEFGGRKRDILVGVSRKSMIYRLYGITPEEALPQTQVLHYEALRQGAAILRVHDVAEAVRTVKSFFLLQDGQ